MGKRFWYEDKDGKLQEVYEPEDFVKVKVENFKANIIIFCIVLLVILFANTCS